MKNKLTKRHKMAAFVLNKEFGYTQNEIGTLMKVNQSSISNAIKEIGYEKEIYDLKMELEEARIEISKTLPPAKPLILNMVKD
ncbi:hypothetical protein [Solibacillus sp. FSL W8-0372]|uniref:hypothetical protein n=1 Tax=Solibacillus sp. FSL W8-0372 TaxID=2921713 RepID=UPI0030D2DDA8